MRDNLVTSSIRNKEWGVACSLYNRGATLTKAQACFPRFKFAITEISSGNMVCVSMSMSTDAQHPP
jgi:hypothetical protein